MQIATVKQLGGGDAWSSEGEGKNFIGLGKETSVSVAEENCGISSPYLSWPITCGRLNHHPLGKGEREKAKNGGKTREKRKVILIAIF